MLTKCKHVVHTKNQPVTFAESEAQKLSDLEEKAQDYGGLVADQLEHERQEHRLRQYGQNSYHGYVQRNFVVCEPDHLLK